MNNVLYGWKRTQPLQGFESISMFSALDTKELLTADTLAKTCDTKKACSAVISFLKQSDSCPNILFSEVDPLDISEDVEYIMEELAAYNKMSIMHNLYIETCGREPDLFSRLIKTGPAYVGIKIKVMERLESDHSQVDSAAECLLRSIESPELAETERFLIVSISEESSIEVLREYFEIIRDALITDDRHKFAIGAALASFDLIIRPAGASIAKILDAYICLTDPDLGLSQRISVDTSLFQGADQA